MWLVNTAPTFGVDFGDASVGTVTLTITRANGTVVVTDDATTNNLDGTYSYQLAKANNTQLDQLKLEWTVVPTSEVVTLYEEITGNLLFTIEEARLARFTGQQSPLSDEDDFPDSTIARMRSLIAGAFEEKTGRSWITRYCRMRLHGDGSREISLYRGHPSDVDGNETGGSGRLWDIRRVISVEIDDVAYTDFELHGRRLINTSGTWPRSTWANPFNIVVEYEYGHDPVPLEARENGLRTVVANLVPSDVPDYAQTLSDPGGTSVSFQQADALRGMLRVWPERTREWLDRNPARRIPVVA